MNVRILHIVGDSKFGGASYGILRLAKFWKSIGWEVDILATDETFLKVALAEGVQTRNVDAIWREIRPLRDLIGLFRLYRFLKRSSYTVVHTHTTKAGFIGRIAARLAGVSVVVHTVHGFAFHETSSWRKIAFYTILERIAALACDRVVTVSNFHAAWAQRLAIAPPEKILAIANGIPEPPAISPEEIATVRTQWEIQQGQTVILTPGRLAPEKGIEDLIQAMALLQPRWQGRLVLMIVGEGTLRSRLEALATQRGLQQHVRFLGFKSDIPPLLAASDFVVLPTWREGLSIALLEAMAQSKAIVTTSIGPNLEATQHGRGALLVNPGDPSALAEAIQLLATDLTLRHSFEHQARAIYETHYDQQSMLAGYHQLYLELLKEGQSAQSVSSLLSSSNR